MTLVGADVSAKIGGDELGRFLDGHGFNTRPINNGHDHLMLVEQYLAGLKVQKLMMTSGLAESNLRFNQHCSGTYWCNTLHMN